MIIKKSQSISHLVSNDVNLIPINIGIRIPNLEHNFIPFFVLRKFSCISEFIENPEVFKTQLEIESLVIFISKWNLSKNSMPRCCEFHLDPLFHRKG